MRGRAALVLVVFVAVAASCGSAGKPIKVTFHVGETKTYDASQLPSHSTLVCSVNRRESGRVVPYTNTIDVPAWSTWDPRSNDYGWMQGSVVGDISFGIHPEKHGKLLLVSCAHVNNSEVGFPNSAAIDH